MQVQHYHLNADRLEPLVNPHSPGQGMLVVIDPAVGRAGDLAAGVLPGATVLVLDPARDGIAQISHHLQHHRGYTSLHLISHGGPGRLYLGSTQLALANLPHYAAHFRQWAALFGDRFDLLLYGCEVAQGTLGRIFVQQLAHLTQARLAASSTLTGQAALGGNWHLDWLEEAQAPQMLALTPAAMNAYPSILATFNVNNAAELINAINQANTTGEADEIILNAPTFSLDSVAVNDSIFGAAGLPTITSNITIRRGTPANVTIERSGGPDFRLFLVREGGNLTLDGVGTTDGLTIRGGRATGSESAGKDGGALLNAGGTVTIRHAHFTQNFAADDGGAILNLGVIGAGGGPAIATMTIEDSRFTNNEARGDDNPPLVPPDDGGGAIENDGNLTSGPGGTNLVIRRTTITDNNASGGTGGGIRIRNGANLTIEDSTVTNNGAVLGGGISIVAAPGVPDNTTSLTITNTVVNNNTSPGDGNLNVVDATPGQQNRTTINNGGGNDVGPTNAPELASAPLIQITPEGSAVPLADGQTSPIGLGTVNLGTDPTPTTFRIQNIGSADLTFDAVAIAGPDAGRFALTPPALTTLTPNQETTFTLTYTASQVGTVNGTVQVTNTNAVNVSADKIFDFAVAGITEASGPKIKVELLDGGGNPLGQVMDNRTIPLPLGNVVQNNPASPTTFRISNTGDQPLNLGPVTFTGSDGSRFIVDAQPATTVNPNDTTTFRLAYNADTVGSFNATANFTTDAVDNPDGTFNFAIQGVVNSGAPTLVVTKINGLPETATDGATTPILLGDTAPNAPKTVIFEVRNAGSADLNLAAPVVVGANANQFSIVNPDPNPFPTTLGAGQTARFSVQFQGSEQANLDARVQIANVNDPVISADGLFDFAIRGTVGGGLPAPGPLPTTNRLLFDATARVFALGDTALNGSNLQLRLNNITSSKILDVRVSKLDVNKQTVESFSPLAILPDGFRPNGFTGVNQSSIFSFSQVQAGDRFTISVQTIDGQVITLESGQAQVRDLGGGQFALTFSDGSFGSVELLLTQTPTGDLLGAGPNQRQDLEILDLSGVLGTAIASFRIYREALFNNVVGFYRIDDLSGRVGGITPGQPGYAQAALNARVPGADLSTANQGLATFSASLTSQALYAPFILVNADVSQFFAENPDNLPGAGPQAYFVFMGANPDGADHVRLLGDNLFGFEDLPGGGDRDFNDLIVRVDLSMA